MFKFLHAADLHLDSPLRGLDRYEGAPVEAMRQATRRAVENLVQLAIDERVAFVLIAGDVYDGDWPDYNTGLFFVRQMARLRDAGIPVYSIRGNHDAESVITRSLSLPDNVRSLSTEQPETVVDEATGTAIHGQGFAKRAVTVDLTSKYPRATPGCFNIGLLHTSAGGCSEHETYAPCSVEGLRSQEYDYWALGHIHLRQTLCDDGAFIAFSGNTQGRHIRETGPKGCLLVSVDGASPQAEFRALDVFRWAHAKPDASQCGHPDDVLEAVASELRDAEAKADGRPLAVRVEVGGQCEVHQLLTKDAERWTAEIHALAARELGDQVWIERIRFRTAPPSDELTELADGPLAELRQHLAQVRTDDSQLRELAVELADLKKKLPSDLADELVCLDDAAWLRSLVDETEQMLFSRLTGGGV